MKLQTKSSSARAPYRNVSSLDVSGKGRAVGARLAKLTPPRHTAKYWRPDSCIGWTKRICVLDNRALGDRKKARSFTMIARLEIGIEIRDGHARLCSCHTAHGSG